MGAAMPGAGPGWHAPLGGAARAGDAWEFRVTPYIWLPTFDGNFAVGRDQPSEVETSLLDVLEGAALVSGEVRNGDFALLGEFNYLDLAHDASSPQGRFGVDVGIKGTMTSMALAARLHEDDTTALEVFGGARLWSVSTTVDFKRLQTRSIDRTWIDPIVGLRASHDLSETVFVEGLGDIGGFGVGSDLQWEGVARVGYRISEGTAVALGYRYLHVDFHDSSLLMDADLRGAFVALDIRF